VRTKSETGEYMDDDEVNIYLQDDLVMKSNNYERRHCYNGSGNLEDKEGSRS
jgi:hypothetical protein